jgi:hypothetical protein
MKQSDKDEEITMPRPGVNEATVFATAKFGAAASKQQEDS